MTDTPRKESSDHEGDKANKIGSPSPDKTPAIKIKGRRLPYLDRKLSEIQPTIGSAIASYILIIVNAKPTSQGSTPRYILKTAKATAGYNQSPHISSAVPKPYDTFVVIGIRSRKSAKLLIVVFFSSISLPIFRNLDFQSSHLSEKNLNYFF